MIRRWNSNSKNEPNQDQSVPQTIKHKNEMAPRTGHFKKHPERESNKENKREHELAVSAPWGVRELQGNSLNSKNLTFTYEN